MVVKQHFNKELRIRPRGKNRLGSKPFSSIFQLQKQIKDITNYANNLKKQYSEIKEANLKLSNSERKLRQISKIKDKYITGISQELIESLETLTGFFSIMYNHTETLTQGELKEFATRMDISVKNMIVLLNNLMVWFLLQRNELKIKSEVIKLNDIISQNISFFYHIALKKDIIITSTLINNIWVPGDRDIIDYIFKNIISSSLKFTNKGGIINIIERQIKNYVEITIHDTEIDISADTLKKMFKANTPSVALSSSDKIFDSGLYYCHLFIKKLSGKLWIESNINGTSVIFTLPIANKTTKAIKKKEYEKV